MKVIFLDIDGVLNSFGQQHGYPMVDPSLAKNFNRIVNETDAKVVVSSTWRHMVHRGHMSLHGFEQLFRSHNIHCSVIGVTPDAESVEGRGWQIRDWLSGKYDQIEKWCVIDDMPDKLMLTMPLVRTNGSAGLTKENAAQAIAMLT